MSNYQNIEFTDTSQSDQWIKALIYGSSGSGKTSLLGTHPSILIVSAEMGTKSIRHKSLPVARIRNLAGLEEALDYAQSGEAAKYGITALGIDSISEIAEVLLAEFMVGEKEPRRAYGKVQDVMLQTVRTIRDMEGLDIFVTAKQELVTDSDGALLFGPAMPGKKLGPALPYFFDGVWVTQVTGTGESRNHVLRTASDYQYSAKDRSGLLAELVTPDLPFIINTIRPR